jgi:hypothetical protein
MTFWHVGPSRLLVSHLRCFAADPGGHRWKVDWIATDSEALRLSYAERRTTAEEYVARIEALRALGEGYSEVSLADRA